MPDPHESGPPPGGDEVNFLLEQAVRQANGAETGCIEFAEKLHALHGWVTFFVLPLFAATILGTIGNIYGALIGGLVIGVVQQMSTAFLLSTYKPAVAFFVMILILLIRPQGIFGGSRK